MICPEIPDDGQFDIRDATVRYPPEWEKEVVTEVIFLGEPFTKESANIGHNDSAIYSIDGISITRYEESKPREYFHEIENGTIEYKYDRGIKTHGYPQRKRNDVVTASVTGGISELNISPNTLLFKDVVLVGNGIALWNGLKWPENPLDGNKRNVDAECGFASEFDGLLPKLPYNISTLCPEIVYYLFPNTVGDYAEDMTQFPNFLLVRFIP